jgi:hypothetical protein
MSADKTSIDKTSADKKSVDKTSVGKVSVDKMYELCAFALRNQLRIRFITILFF